MWLYTCQKFGLVGRAKIRSFILLIVALFLRCIHSFSVYEVHFCAAFIAYVLSEIMIVCRCRGAIFRAYSRASSSASSFDCLPFTRKCLLSVDLGPTKTPAPAVSSLGIALPSTQIRRQFPLMIVILSFVIFVVSIFSMIGDCLFIIFVLLVSMLDEPGKQYWILMGCHAELVHNGSIVKVWSVWCSILFCLSMICLMLYILSLSRW